MVTMDGEPIFRVLGWSVGRTMGRVKVGGQHCSPLTLTIWVQILLLPKNFSYRSCQKYAKKRPWLSESNCYSVTPVDTNWHGRQYRRGLASFTFLLISSRVCLFRAKKLRSKWIQFENPVFSLRGTTIKIIRIKKICRESSFRSFRQCDQMAGLCLNIWTFTIMEICQRA